MDDEPRGLYLPEFVGGAKRWMDRAGDLGRLRRMVRFGDQLHGWEGDETLDFYYLEREERMVLVKHGPAEGEMHLVRKWDKPLWPNESLIPWLCQHDAQRGYDPMAAVDKANERTERDNVKVTVERMVEAGDRLALALRGQRLWTPGWTK